MVHKKLRQDMSHFVLLELSENIFEAETNDRDLWKRYLYATSVQTLGGNIL